MPVQTSVLSTEPELVEQHVISVDLHPTWSLTSLPRRVLTLTLLTYGATITHLTCPDKTGQIQDLVLGFDDWQDYIRQARGLNPFFGATVGRTASRVANAEFQLDDKTFALQVSNGKDCHHGGPQGFDKRYWTTHRIDHARNAVQLALIDPAGTNGYPGTLETLVEFSLNDQGEVVIEYEARLVDSSPDDATIVSLTNHTYWNLNGIFNRPAPSTDVADTESLVECSVRNHTLWLSSNHLIRLGEDHPVPTGDIVHLPTTCGSHPSLPPCLNLSQDPGQGTLLGPAIDQIPGGYGFDHVYMLDPPSPSSLVPAAGSTAASLQAIGIQGHYPHTPHVATLHSPWTGLTMRLLTSEPALVVYSGGYLDADLLPSTKQTANPTPQQQQQQQDKQEDRPALWRAIMGPHSALCLEPIRIPDAIHHPDWASMAILRKGDTYRQKSVFQLTLDP